ncbi:MAG TPA: hypothetical protein VK206_17095 [Anaerolineales bacterium]|nr:hypothetical protein [Anaerolineales bacterium]
MLNQVKSTFTVTSLRSEAKALVESFAKQDQQQLYPFELQNFKLGVRFQNAEPQTQRVIAMAMLAWLEQHSLKSYGRQDQNAWQMVWKMREAFLHILKFNLPFHEQDMIAMLNWSASQSSTSAYVFFSGVPQIIKVVGAYLKNDPMTDELHEAIERLIQSLESESMSVEVRRWILQLKELTGEAQVGLPLAAGDLWADTALRELYALDSRSKTAWAELLIHCSRAIGSAPSRKWLKEADKYIDTIGSLNFFIKLLHWFLLIDKLQAMSANRHDLSLVPTNVDILKGLVWLCSKADDDEIARALTALAISSYKKISGSGSRATKVGNACFWALGSMPSHEGIVQLSILKDKIKASSGQKRIASALEMAAESFPISE